MKKYPKTIKCDDRGQLVIPKAIRAELGINEGTGFWMHEITHEGILLKKIDTPSLEQEEIVEEIKDKIDKVKIKKENLRKTLKNYKTKKEGNLELI